MSGQSITEAVHAVTKKWAKQRKAEERDTKRKSRRQEALTRTRRTTTKKVAQEVIFDAYLKVSCSGMYPAHARQIMYAARGIIQERTGSTLDDQYFCQRLLPDFMTKNAVLTRNWNVVFDARGHFEEPHTNVIVPLGTLEVEEYLQDTSQHQVGELNLAQVVQGLYPTKGPRHRISAILFVEKEGFMPLFRSTRLAERYDLAIMSTKGLSVTASRRLVDQLCFEHQVPLLVLHDFDKSGFSILATLRNDTRRYAFQNEIQVEDLGLRLDDVQEWNLTSEDVVHKSDPLTYLQENGATEQECSFLRGNSITGKRVELNAFTSPDFIKWIEGKLDQLGIKKVVPEDAVLQQAYRRAYEVESFKVKAAAVAQAAKEEANQVAVPANLAAKVGKQLQNDAATSWDEAVATLARKQFVKTQGSSSNSAS